MVVGQEQFGQLAKRPKLRWYSFRCNVIITNIQHSKLLECANKRRNGRNIATTDKQLLKVSQSTSLFWELPGKINEKTQNNKEYLSKMLSLISNSCKLTRFCNPGTPIIYKIKLSAPWEK